MKHTTILIILDGLGVGRKDQSNPVYTANPKNLNFVEANFPAGTLQAHGIAVGLPWEHPGESKIGHLAIGSGRTPLDDRRTISAAIEDGSFFQNQTLSTAFQNARAHNAAVHLIGPISENPEDAALDHLLALMEFGKRSGVKNFRLHLFLDKTSLALTGSLGEPASIAGRFYGMDETRDWEKTKTVYTCVAKGAGHLAKNLTDALSNIKKSGLKPEFAPPTVIGEPHSISPGDSVVLFNLEESGMFQTASPFVLPDFQEFPVHHPKNITAVTFVKHPEAAATTAAFPHPAIKNTLSEVISESGKSQLKITETLKWVHLNYFMNGLREEPFKGEFRVTIPSEKSPWPEISPAMMAKSITDRLVMSIHENSFDFIVANYPNADFMTHTGNIKSVEEAIRFIDKEIGRLLEPALAGGHTLIVTSDHGNAESIINLKTGLPENQHSRNPVPFYIINKNLRKSTSETPPEGLPTIGILSDIAPTILAIMQLPTPAEMTGENLLNQIA